MRAHRGEHRRVVVHRDARQDDHVRVGDAGRRVGGDRGEGAGDLGAPVEEGVVHVDEGDVEAPLVGAPREDLGVVPEGRADRAHDMGGVAAAADHDVLRLELGFSHGCWEVVVGAWCVCLSESDEWACERRRGEGRREREREDEIEEWPIMFSCRASTQLSNSGSKLPASTELSVTRNKTADTPKPVW